MASVIGQIVKKPDRRIIVTETDGIPLERPITDELWNALKKLNPP
ncbi:MAG: hypothetical protein ACXAAO_15655 [Candidatus Thorarchaeota archaeon]